MECNGLISKNLTNPSERNPTKLNGCCTTISLLEGEELFFNRILSRDSSKGFSSRVYYQVAGKVPFAWEAKPGIPKITHEAAPLPPLSPPPAMLSLSVSHTPVSKDSNQSRLWFWKKKKATKAQKSESQSQTGSEVSFESWSYEGDSTWSTSPSPCNSSSSSSLYSFGSPIPPMVAKRTGPAEGKRVKDLRKRRGMKGLVWCWSYTAWRFSGVIHG
ncbi:putative OSBPoxysterol binding protein-related protein 4B [Cinnamomum micranthum f. kanehirae]|uniref:Putative OSBPoxysterol binding protein-related protein 4B n=1 Tax=Cinnamomum micranthum f. kanehirae TaxID=337451 RepID=A0A3S4PJS0_9MAGN|nr:putative OSBPoxysterol binding protein-related protein 4B [Cinnamomum micranthum f. kanehirae]